MHEVVLVILFVIHISIYATCNPLRGDTKSAQTINNGTMFERKSSNVNLTLSNSNVKGSYKTLNATDTSGTNNSDVTPQPSVENELPLPIIIASPVVAVFIVIFICVTYKWHTVQLDSQAKELAIQVAAGVCAPSQNSCLPCSPCRPLHTTIPPDSPSDVELLPSPVASSPRRKSHRSPTHSTMLTPPPHGLGGRRGSRCSNWSSVSDQEVLNHSPRRHSTFLL